MRIFLLITLLMNFAHAAAQEVYYWEKGQTYLNFLEKHELPLRTLYYNLDREDQKITEEIFAGT